MPIVASLKQDQDLRGADQDGAVQIKINYHQDAQSTINDDLFSPNEGQRFVGSKSPI